MLIKKNEDGQKLLLPAQIAKIYSVSRPTAGKWVEMAEDGENNLNIYKTKTRTFVIDTEANHKELHLLREKGIKYKNKSDYEKIEVAYDFVNGLNDVSRSQLVLAFENKQLPLKFALQNTPELFGNEFETKKDKIKKQRLQLKNFTQLFCSQQLPISYKILALQTLDTNLIEAVAEGLVGYQDEPSLNLVHPGKINLSTINEALFSSINYIQADFEVESIAKALHSPITNLHQGNLILLGDYLINKSFDIGFTLQNLAKTMTTRDYLMFNVKTDSVALDVFATNYFDTEKLRQRNKAFLNKIGITDNQYELEYKYNEISKAHQYLLVWNKEVDFVFGGLNLSFREGDQMALEQLACFTQAILFEKIQQAGLEVVQLASNSEYNEDWLMVRKVTPRKLFTN